MVLNAKLFQELAASILEMSNIRTQVHICHDQCIYTEQQYSTVHTTHTYSQKESRPLFN